MIPVLQMPVSGDYVSRILQTVLLFWGFMMPGVGDSVLGPTLLDLQLLSHQSVDRFSYLILSTGVGAVVGSLLAGLLFTGIDPRLKSGISIICGSLINAVTAAVPKYAYFLTMYGLQGLARGFVAVYLLEVCNQLWQEKATAFQFIFCGVTVGGILTPLIAKPFLCTGNQTHAASADYQELEFVESVSNSSFVDNNCTADDTSVQYAYLVLGLLTLPSGIAFVYVWFTHRQRGGAQSELPYETFDDSPAQGNHEQSNKTLKVLFLVCLFLFSLPLVGNTMTYNAYLTVFGVEGPLHIAKGSMVYMTSLYWAALLTSRVVNTLLTPCCGDFKIILVNAILLLASGLILVTLAGSHEAALWSSTVCLGLFSGPFQGAILSWAGRYLNINARVISVVFLGVGFGALILPFSGGQLYHWAPPMGHMYLVFSMIIFLCLMFFVLNVIGRMLDADKNRQHLEIASEPEASSTT